MLPIVTDFLDHLNPYLQPFYFLIAWLLVLIVILSTIGIIRDIRKRAIIMHQIPCSDCRYFTNNYYLKCPLQPKIANTELAINCPDFCQEKSLYKINDRN